MKKLFSFSEAETEYINTKQDKIELVSCPRKKMICQEHLSIVNKCYVESEQYFRNKEFEKSISILKDAFYKTTELVNSPCIKCAVLFRSTIIESLEMMHDEMEKMTIGFWGNKKYQQSCINASNVLKEFENLKLHNMSQPNESEKRFIGNFQKKNVS